MKPIQFTSSSYLIDDKPIFLISGEIHYFRVPKPDWRRRMQLFKEAGGNCLATYIPWLIHEPAEGRFRFGEAGEIYDLEGYLQAAMEAGLYVIARPGPYQYSELIYDGLPGWLLENYPDVLAQNIKGQVFRPSSISYLHPTFLAKAQKWFDQVCPILARYTIQQGGPVAFVQFDNELVGVHEWFGSLDYNPVGMGIGQPGGRYPTFLACRYGTVAELNRSYQTSYPSFEAVRPPDPVSTSLAGVRACKDYFDFYLDGIGEYAARLRDMIRSHGIEVPLMHNSGNPGMNSYFLETAEKLGKDFVLGSDHYYNLGQEWAQNNPTPQYASKSFLSLEVLRLMGYPPSVLEMPGGNAVDWPPLLAGDALAAYFTNLAFGMKGVNYYIFTGGPNPPGAGATTDVYDFSAAISADGEIRPLYHAQKAFGEFMHKHAWLASAERAYDLRMGWDHEYLRAHQYWRRGGEHLSPLETGDFLRRGPLSAAFCSGLSPRLVDLGADDWVMDASTPLLVASGSSMARAFQKRLVKFVQHGGKLLMMPVLPTLDEHLQPCTLLAEFLGSPKITANAREVVRNNILGVSNVNCFGGNAYFYDDLPKNAAILGTDELTGKTIAWKFSAPGGGEALVLGMTWSHGMREHERMLVKLVENLGLKRKITCSDPNVWATLWEHGDKAILFVLNLLTAKLEAELSVKLGGKTVSTGKLSLDPISVTPVELKI